MRHHIAGIKLVGALGFLPIGPVVGLLQEDAKCALLLLQPLDQRDCVIRCADHAVLVLDKPFERVLAGRHHETALVVVQVIEVSLESETGVLERLFAGLGDMHRADEAQSRWVHLAAMLGGDVAGDLPIARQGVVTERVGGGDANHAQIVFPGEAPARGCNGTDHRHFGMGLGVGRQMQPRIDEGVPVGLFGDGLVTEEPQDHVDPLGHPVALGHRIDPEHQRVGGKKPRSGAEHDAPARVMVELDDAIRHHQRVVVGQ